MKTLAIVHPDLSINGGGEAVCAHVLDALADVYNIVLVTWSDINRSQLDDLFGTNLVRKNIRTIAIGSQIRLPSLLTKRAAFQFAFAVRYIQASLDEYDAVISTWCEIAVSKPALQYVHVPLFVRGVSHEWLSGRRSSLAHKALWAGLRFAARKLAHGSRAGYRRSVSVANSAWTAQLVKKALRTSPEIIWPPIPTSSRSGMNWEKRENEFICIGRLVEGKRVLEIIDCIHEVRQAGYNVTLHVVGGGVGKYADTVVKRCRETDFAIYEGRLSSLALFDLMGRCKYGIHGFPYEHFGIALAQMISAGCLCFAPASGGQTELLIGKPELLYRTFSDAAKKITTVLSDPTLQNKLLHDLDEVRNSINSHDFQRVFRSFVGSRLLAP